MVTKHQNQNDLKKFIPPTLFFFFFISIVQIFGFEFLGFLVFYTDVLPPPYCITAEKVQTLICWPIGTWAPERALWALKHTSLQKNVVSLSLLVIEKKDELSSTCRLPNLPNKGTYLKCQPWKALDCNGSMVYKWTSQDQTLLFLIITTFVNLICTLSSWVKRSRNSAASTNAAWANENPHACQLLWGPVLRWPRQGGGRNIHTSREDNRRQEMKITSVRERELGLREDGLSLH